MRRRHRCGRAVPGPAGWALALGLSARVTKRPVERGMAHSVAGPCYMDGGRQMPAPPTQLRVGRCRPPCRRATGASRGSCTEPRAAGAALLRGDPPPLSRTTLPPPVRGRPSPPSAPRLPVPCSAVGPGAWGGRPPARTGEGTRLLVLRLLGAGCRRGHCRSTGARRRARTRLAPSVRSLQGRHSAPLAAPESGRPAPAQRCRRLGAEPGLVPRDCRG